METAPEKYPSAILAIATIRLSARTLRRTRTTERWRSMDFNSRRRVKLHTRWAYTTRGEGCFDLHPGDANPIEFALSIRILNYSALEDMRGGNRPPPQLDFPDNVLLGHETPMAAVGAVVPVVTHHEVVTLGHDSRAEVVVAAELRRDEPVVHRHVVHVHAAV